MLTVIIPAYIPTRTQHSLFLRAIKSLEKQTFKNFKVICVLNGCYTDYDYIKKSVKSSLTIEYIALSGKASGAIARNAGIKASNTKYIAQLDADDQYHEEKLEKQIEFLENNSGVDVVGTLAYSVYTDGTIVPQSSTPGEYETHEQISNRLKTGNCICCGSLMFRKEVFNNISYEERYKPGDVWPTYGARMYEDFDLWKRMCKRGIIFHNLNDRLYYHSVGTSGGW